VKSKNTVRLKKLDAAFIYLLAMFVIGAANKMVSTTNTIYRVQVLGLDALQLVLLGTMLEVTIFLFEIPTGIVADVYSRRLSTIIGIILVGVGHAMEGLTSLFSVALIAQFVWGVGTTFISGAFAAWVTDEVGLEKIGKVFLRADQLGLFGSLLAIPLAVWLSVRSLSWPYYAGGILFVLLALFLMFFMSEHGFTPVPKEERQGWRTMVNTFRGGLNLARSRPVLITFAVIGLFVGLYSEAWDRLAQPYLLQNFTFPSLNGIPLTPIEWFGILNVAFILGGILFNEIAKRRVDTTHEPALLRALQGIYGSMVAAMLFFSLTGQFYLAVAAMILFNGLRSTTFPLTNAWINQQIDSKVRATVLSMTGQIDALGEMSGGPILGSIGRLFSLHAVLIISSLTLSPTVPLYQKIRNITRK
jgi:DHA3 family tetracycline resistance protein-like MFS transporter